MRYVASVVVFLTTLALPSCKESCSEDEPAPACYSGKVVGAACMDGLLVEVDSQYSIGKAYGPHTNLIAVVNLAQQSTPDYTLDGQTVKPGQTIYFTYTTAPGAREAFCPQNTVPMPIPHLVLSNVNQTACAPAKAR